MGAMMPILLMVAVFYFIIIRPKKNQEKQVDAMRKQLEVGDEIVTIGGILGRVVSVKEDVDSILIESGSANTKLRITKSAVQTNLTATEKMREKQQEAAAAAAEEKERKKAEKAAKKEGKL